MILATRKLHLRSFASLSSSQVNSAQSPFKVFDRQAKRSQKDRAVACDGGNRSRTVDYVRNEVADRMMERFLASVHYDELILSTAKRLFRILRESSLPSLTLGLVQVISPNC
jgi:hypothetical protein